MKDTTWRDSAACRDTPIEVFFPIGDPTDAEAAPARAICSRCDVWEACREFAATEPEGIWFGTTPQQRRRGRRLPRQRPPEPLTRACANPACDLPGRLFKPIRARQICCSRTCGRTVAAYKSRSPFPYASGRPIEGLRAQVEAETA